jgi:hypothetical protein
VDFNVTGQLLVSSNISEIMTIQWKSTAAIYSREVKEAYDTLGKELVYNIFFEIGISLKVVRVK